MDTFDKKKRSEIMSLIRSKNTKAEMVVFKYLRKEKVYFQMHYKRAIGNPDIALPNKKRAVFIDGDFWHGREFEKTMNRLPKVYWRDKIARNIVRDKETRQGLKEKGWELLQVWESDIIRKRTREETFEKIKNFLTAQK